MINPGMEKFGSTYVPYRAHSPRLIDDMER